MAVRPTSALAKAMYATLFVVVLPVLLVAWARTTENTLHIPVPDSIEIAGILVFAGFVFVIWGMLSLWFRGGGLPMNLAPPPRLVTEGIFRILPHPIYTGFCLACAGIALLARSASGLWLATPTMALCCVALVLGYERHDLRARFGEDAVRATSILPPASQPVVTSRDRIAAFVHVIFLWFILYEAVIALGIPRDAISVFLPFERAFPVWQWSEIFYASVYPIALSLAFIIRSGAEMRRFCFRAWAVMAIVFPLYVLLPLVAPPRPFTSTGWFGNLLEWERALDGPMAAFPSFHVVWALLAADVISRRFPAARWVARGWAWLVAASCVTTGMHGILDVVAGFLAVMVVGQLPRIWERLRAITENTANAWKDWRLGPLRVINHGIFAGLAGFIGMVMAQSFAGTGNSAALLFAMVCGVVGAALWAQVVEGSASLLRPFGYYGSVLGTVLGLLAAPWFHADTWILISATAVAAPWVQAIGRVRCLIQGCCHGKPADDRVGIRHFHPMSRVTRLTQWQGVPLHATPLYSILWNIVVGLLLARLWSLNVEAHLITGIYFIWTGAGRFVEEAYRGEPQTRVIAGLRMYQWLAVLSVVAGMIVTSHGPAAAAPSIGFDWRFLLPALAFGLFNWFAYGMDFPESSRRFSRLA